ncbi:keratin-associated protein 19-9b-like [Eubalaena glacialis]|nr:keratin-associated protein 19-9b-like [Eubalaena glacialis]
MSYYCGNYYGGLGYGLGGLGCGCGSGGYGYVCYRPCYYGRYCSSGFY